jgi:hypothetical protein
MKQNPFPEAETDPKALHVSFLFSAPTNPNLKALEGLKKESERFELIDRVFYLHSCSKKPDRGRCSCRTERPDRIFGRSRIAPWARSKALHELSPY